MPAPNSQGVGRPADDGGGPGAADGDEDWPEPARPGGASPAPVAPTAAAMEDWPEAARPGGVPAGPAPAGLAVAQADGAPVSSAIAAARAAAAGAGNAQRPAPAGRKTADADWAGEPQCDPDYGDPVRPGSGGGVPAVTPAYEGFDPGDEPLDEVIDERTARESSEEQAVRLLREAFGAETLKETDTR